MGRKPEGINQECGKRLKSLLTDKDMSGAELARLTHYTQQHISRIINGKSNLKDNLAKQICNIFPEINMAWLLGLDDRKTVRELTDEFIRECVDLTDACSSIVSFAVKNNRCTVKDPTEQEHDKGISFYIVRGNSRPIAITKKVAGSLCDDLLDYATFAIAKIIKNGGEKNG